MTTRRAGRLATTLLLAAATTLALAGPAGAATEELTGFADATLDGVDGGSGRTVHGVFSVYDPPGTAPFGVMDVFLGGGAGEEPGIVYECTTGERTPAHVDRLRAAWAAGVLPVTCASPVGLPERTGHVYAGLSWRGEGPVESLVFDHGACTEHLDVRSAAVRGGVLLVVPGVAVTRMTPHDHPADELRRQRLVCG